MRAWREHSDPWAEAERLEVAKIVRRLGWNKRKLSAELERVTSAEKFIGRIEVALRDLDRPQYLSRSSVPAYTPHLHLALDGAEAVPEHAQRKISKEAREGFQERRNGEFEARRRHSLGARLIRAQKDSQERAVDIGSSLRVIERQLERIERKLDRVA